jgi:hypothetical protein
MSKGYSSKEAISRQRVDGPAAAKKTVRTKLGAVCARIKEDKEQEGVAPAQGN